MARKNMLLWLAVLTLVAVALCAARGASAQDVIPGGTTLPASVVVTLCADTQALPTDYANAVRTAFGARITEQCSDEMPRLVFTAPVRKESGATSVASYLDHRIVMVEGTTPADIARMTVQKVEDVLGVRVAFVVNERGSSECVLDGPSTTTREVLVDRLKAMGYTVDMEAPRTLTITITWQLQGPLVEGKTETCDAREVVWEIKGGGVPPRIMKQVAPAPAEFDQQLATFPRATVVAQR